MNKEFEVKFGSVIFDKINTVRMSDQERLVAVNAMRDADAIVEAIVWFSNKIEQLGSFLFLKPGVKH